MMVSLEDLHNLAVFAMKNPPRNEKLLCEMFANPPADTWNPAMNSSYSPYLSLAYHFCKRYRPPVVVELGLENGRWCAAACLASPSSCVTGVDIVDRISDHWTRWLMQCDNAHIRLCPSQWFLKCYDGPKINLLHLDSSHEPDQTREEWELIQPLMAPGGVILMDDLETIGVGAVWKEITIPHVELKFLHPGGSYGAVVSLGGMY